MLGMVAGLLGVGPAAAEPESRRLNKQIGLFERAVDDMLVESPNFLVHSQDNTRGTYLDGHGAVFTFKTSLNTWPGGFGDNHRWSWSDDDVHVVVLSESSYEVRGGKEWRERRIKKQETLYDLGKKELIETIVDFGDLLSTLDGEDWLKLEARLRGAEFFKEKDIRRLTIQVKMRDVRAHADGTLDEDELARRIETEEN